MHPKTWGVMFSPHMHHGIDHECECGADLPFNLQARISSKGIYNRRCLCRKRGTKGSCRHCDFRMSCVLFAFLVPHHGRYSGILPKECSSMAALTTSTKPSLTTRAFFFYAGVNYGFLMITIISSIDCFNSAAEYDAACIVLFSG